MSKRALWRSCIQLRDKLFGEATNRIQLNSIRENDLQFLHANCFVGCYTLADGINVANKGIIDKTSTAGSPRFWDQSQRLLISIANNTVRPYRTMNAVVISSNGLAMPFEHRELVLQSGQITRHVTGITILCHQLERHILTATANQ